MTANQIACKVCVGEMVPQNIINLTSIIEKIQSKNKWITNDTDFLKWVNSTEEQEYLLKLNIYLKQENYADLETLIYEIEDHHFTETELMQCLAEKLIEIILVNTKDLPDSAIYSAIRRSISLLQNNIEELVLPLLKLEEKFLSAVLNMIYEAFKNNPPKTGITKLTGEIKNIFFKYINRCEPGNKALIIIGSVCSLAVLNIEIEDLMKMVSDLKKNYLNSWIKRNLAGTKYETL